MSAPQSKLQFRNGIEMPNRFALAPLTNTQSHENGQLSKEEFKWLTMRAEGGFGMVITCASHVQEIGKGFPGQLGIFDDRLNEGHLKLTSKIKEYGSLAIIQLHHAGMRTPIELIDNQKAVSASDIEAYNARALTLEEIDILKNDFIAAAVRAQKCGYDGVEIHGAHGYIIAQFLSSEFNHRKDKYGGSLENRAKLLFDIVDGVRKACGTKFLLGVRLSPEKFGMDIAEIKWMIEKLISDGKIDFIDISLWDCFKLPTNEKYQNKVLIHHFTAIDFKDVKWMVAGKIYTAQDVRNVLDAGADIVSIGTAAILHHDFPKQVINNFNFTPIETPVSIQHLINEGLSSKFIQYLKKWPNLIEKD
ncbi:MAG: NADH:flavin oxidoreductase [Weeksellaceae bacterium]